MLLFFFDNKGVVVLLMTFCCWGSIYLVALRGLDLSTKDSRCRKEVSTNINSTTPPPEIARPDQ